ncbi:MAG: class I SAM-dependent methyltransferase [Deltaproteobacteria bacterium]|nr:class I SAM-dependent methyltransferase [Deltaproteobacteria bacterium]
MSRKSAPSPDYGNWVSVRLLMAAGGLGLLLLGLSFLSPFSILSWFLLVGAVLCFAFLAYLAYARHLFSPRGRDIQAKILALIISRLDWDGKGRALDIGCGNGALVIELAQKYPQAQVTGLDYWGGLWGYSQETCQANARIEGVADRVVFQKGSAAALPFPDETFDLAVSNFVFHNVKGVSDKREIIREALRVVRPGGRFVFQDLFLVKQFYGRVDELLATVESFGVREVEFVNTTDSPFIPRLLKLPFMVGAIGIIHGTK